MTPRRLRSTILVITVALLAACGSNPADDGPPRSSSGSVGTLPGDAIPKPEPRSRYGNPATYEVFGKRYSVMPSAVGYKERGVASWYGKKFHGKKTSTQEVYDMYQMTAAHKSLPLPTYVRVTNLENDKTIVVRVNDRGPFVDNRIIDLSYAAAQRLDMVTSGTIWVEVEAITFDGSGSAQPTRQVSAPPPANVPQPQAAPAGGMTHQIYVQIGAFGSRANADRRLALLRSGGIAAAAVHTDTTADPTLYRVRLGPLHGVEEYDLLVDELTRLGIADHHIVTD